jgi:sulfatase maturation enzyme AslB (radical SAM superfamily)
MLTKVVEMCHERGIIFSTRVSIDGVGDMHNEVRNVKRGFDKALETIRAMQALQKKYRFNFGISSTIFSMNLDDAENILSWARKEKLDIVFNMVRFTDAMLNNDDLQGKVKPIGPEEERMRQFFLDRVRMDPLLDGQNYIYMHYADMISNGYHRLAPCPFQTQGVMLNPDGGLFFCENSDVMGNVRDEDPEAIYFRASSQQHRDMIRDEKCPGPRRKSAVSAPTSPCSPPPPSSGVSSRAGDRCLPLSSASRTSQVDSRRRSRDPSPRLRDAPDSLKTPRDGHPATSPDSSSTTSHP